MPTHESADRMGEAYEEARLTGRQVLDLRSNDEPLKYVIGTAPPFTGPVKIERSRLRMGAAGSVVRPRRAPSRPRPATRSATGRSASRAVGRAKDAV